MAKTYSDFHFMCRCIFFLKKIVEKVGKTYFVKYMKSKILHLNLRKILVK